MQQARLLHIGNSHDVVGNMIQHNVTNIYDNVIVSISFIQKINLQVSKPLPNWYENRNCSCGCNR